MTSFQSLCADDDDADESERCIVIVIRPASLCCSARMHGECNGVLAYLYNDHVDMLLKWARATACRLPVLASNPSVMLPLPASIVTALLLLLAPLCVASQAHAIDSVAVDSVVAPRLIRSGYFGIHQSIPYPGHKLAFT